MKKIFPHLLTIILLASNVFLLAYPFKRAYPINTSLILLLNFTIILSATYFGVQGIITFGLFSLFAILVHSLRISEFSLLPLILLGATMLIFYTYCLKENRFINTINTELDNIEEEKNVQAVELKHLRVENTALKQKLNRYTMLKWLTETLSTTLSLDEACSLITSEATRIIGKSNAVLLYLVDKEKQELKLVNTKIISLPAEVKLKKGDLFDHWVFKQHTPLLVEDTKKDFRFNVQNIQPELKRVRSLICVPLISANKLLGILRLDNVSARAYDTDDLRLLDIIADLAAVAIENTLLYKETERLAITDGLSGLFVHRYFHQRFDQEVSRALWTDAQFSFLMLDIDDFKSYNDRYGHIAGDIVLKWIARIITASVNPGDIVARYGGEEFGVLLVDTAKSQALKIAEAMRRRIEKEQFTLRRETTQVRISGGISSFPEDGKVKENLIEKADRALYQAKAEGKNKICTA